MRNEIKFKLISGKAVVLDADISSEDALFELFVRSDHAGTDSLTPFTAVDGNCILF